MSTDSLESASAHAPFAAGTVTGFFHAGVTVRDMEDALRFYRDTLGLEVVGDGVRSGDNFVAVQGIAPESVRVVFLQVPGSEAQIELFEYHGIERHGASARPCDYGAGHFCLYVDDVPAAAQRLEQRGYRLRRPVHTLEAGPFAGTRVVYAVDPDGYHVELFEKAAR